MPVILARDARPTCRIGIVVSRFNEEVTARLLDGALTRLKALDFTDENVDVVWVPGAVEIPLMAQWLITSKEVDAVVALGAVIRGDTDHYDHVCNQVSYGCQKVALTHNRPVVFGVLTTDTEAQALDRCGGTHGHKGMEAVDAALEMVALKKLTH